MTISAADISKGMAILRETEQGKPLNFEIFGLKIVASLKNFIIY